MYFDIIDLFGIVAAILFCMQKCGPRICRGEKLFEKYAKPMQLLRRNKRFMTGLSSWEWLILKEESLNNNFFK